MITAIQEGRGQQIRRMIVARKANVARQPQKLDEALADRTEAAQALEAVEESDLLEEEEEEVRML